MLPWQLHLLWAFSDFLSFNIYSINLTKEKFLMILSFGTKKKSVWCPCLGTHYMCCNQDNNNQPLKNHCPLEWFLICPNTFTAWNIIAVCINQQKVITNHVFKMTLQSTFHSDQVRNVFRYSHRLSVFFCPIYLFLQW